MPPKGYLTLYPTYIKFILWQSQVNLGNFFLEIPTIASSSGTAPVNRSGHYTHQLIRIPRVLNPYHLSSANLFGTTVAKGKVISPFHNEECISKWLILEEKASLIY